MTLLYITVSSKNKIILTWSQPLWCKSWQMTLNPSKCEALCISNKCPPPLFQCAYDDNVIKWTNAVHYLVVTFNTRLHWNHHCKYVASKATRSFNVLHRIMPGHSKQAKCIEYCALILSILEHASPVWSPYIKQNMQNTTLLESLFCHGAHCTCVRLSVWLIITTNGLNLLQVVVKTPTGQPSQFIIHHFQSSV